MSFIINIKNKIWSYFLKKETDKIKRNRKLLNLSDAKTIGIIYQVNQEEHYNVICSFIKELQDKNKNVRSLGYVKDYNVVPHFCFPKLSYDYFTKKEVNWYKVPSSNFVNDFVKENFDILIDLSNEDCMPIQYISAISNASFKVGLYNDKNKNIYDFMIKVDGLTIQNLINQIKHYLSLINN